MHYSLYLQRVIKVEITVFHTALAMNIHSLSMAKVKTSKRYSYNFFPTFFFSMFFFSTMTDWPDGPGRGVTIASAPFSPLRPGVPGRPASP